MSDFELTLDDINTLRKQDDYSELKVSIVIDFDARLYVNGYPDLLLENYVPRGWKGICDDPRKFLPNEIKNIFQD